MHTTYTSAYPAGTFIQPRATSYVYIYPAFTFFSVIQSYLSKKEKAGESANANEQTFFNLRSPFLRGGIIVHGWLDAGYTRLAMRKWSYSRMSAAATLKRR